MCAEAAHFFLVIGARNATFTKDLQLKAKKGICSQGFIAVSIFVTYIDLESIYEWFGITISCWHACRS